MSKKPNLNGKNDHNSDKSGDQANLTLENSAKNVLSSEGKVSEVSMGKDPVEKIELEIETAPEAPESNSTETVSETETEEVVSENEAPTPIEVENVVETPVESENKDVVATLENPPKWILEHRERMGKDTFEGLKTNHEIVAAAIEKCIADRGKTAMPPLTEKEIMGFVGKQAKLLDINFVYTDQINKTKGYIEIKEFKTVIRVPKEGEFTFGIDYSRGV
jgi:hypothetical protein